MWLPKRNTKTFQAYKYRSANLKPAKKHYAKRKGAARMQRQVNRYRNERGAAMIGLVLALVFFVMICGFFAFEASRVQLAQREVTAICDAASLTGTAMLASSDISNDDAANDKLTYAQENAAGWARNMVLNSNILGIPLTTASNAMNLLNFGNGLQPGQCSYVIGLADPTANYISRSVGDIRGKSVSCFVAYGYRPSFLGMVGVGLVSILGSSYGGLPQIDAVLVFDMSASMDDQTVVTFVRREWKHDNSGAGPQTSFKVNATLKSGAIATTTQGCGIIRYISLPSPTAPHTIVNYLNWDFSTAKGSAGTGVNALAPQNLNMTTSTATNVEVRNSLVCDYYLRTHYKYYDGTGAAASATNPGGVVPGYTPYTAWGAYPSNAPGQWSHCEDYGSPPGNCDLSVIYGGNGDGYSDVTGNTKNSKTGLPYVTGVVGVGNPPPQPCLPSAWLDTTWLNGPSGIINCQPSLKAVYSDGLSDDPIPSTHLDSYTDVVVNIDDPTQCGPSPTNVYPYSQPLAPRFTDFKGFQFTFDANEPDQTIRNQTFDFSNIAVVVEAARGNLELTAATTPGAGTGGLANFYRALLDRNVYIDDPTNSGAGTYFDMNSVKIQNGYQKAYQRLAMMFSQPIYTAMVGADTAFYQRLHVLADCRFGLVGFSNRQPFDPGGATSGTFPYAVTQGTLPKNTTAGGASDDGRSYYTAFPINGNPTFSWDTYFDGTFTTSGDNTANLSTNGNSGAGFRVPRVGLDVNNENYQQVIGTDTTSAGTADAWSYTGKGGDSIYNGRPLSLTDTSEALQTAHQMFHSTSNGNNYDMASATNSRPASRKVIIFFTDGEPTGGINTQEATDTLTIAGPFPLATTPTAKTCQGDGIGIFTVGLNVSNNAQLKSDQADFLGATTDGTGQGLAARAQNNGKFYPCQTGTDVTNAFAAIARKLSQGQR
jgi:von Willebrand factor type A domain